MLRFKGGFKRQVEAILSARQKAMMVTVVLAFLPFCAYLAMIVIALVTLRKGEKIGAPLLLGGVLAHTAFLLTHLSLASALINAVIFFVPGYLAACTLRKTSSWQTVALVLFGLVMMAAVMIQLWAPNWISAQYAVLQSILKASQSEQVLAKWSTSTSGIPVDVLANYVFGIQLLSLVIAVLLPLMIARAVQSQLFHVGGFTKEMLNLRGNRLSLLLFLILAGAAWQWNVIAIDVFPVMAFFYLLAGLSLCASFMVKKSSRLAWLLLILPLLLAPFVMLFLYIFLGLLDSFINIRLAFAVKRG